MIDLLLEAMVSLAYVMGFSLGAYILWCLVFDEDKKHANSNQINRPSGCRRRH